MTDQARGVVRLPDEGRRVALGDAGVVVLKAEGRHSAGRFAAYEFAMPPRTAGPPHHLHRSWDEAFSVLEGEVTFLIDGREHTCPAGSFVFVPRGVPHTFWNAGEAPARQLTVFTPAGIEAYFDAVTGALAAGTPEALAEAERLMAAHDMVVLAGEGPAYGALADERPG